MDTEHEEAEERTAAREAIRSVASVLPHHRHEALLAKWRRMEEAEIRARDEAAQEYLRRNA